jgi:hypothetical protein
MAVVPEGEARFFFFSLQSRRLLPFLQWCCNVWGEDGELRKNDNGVGSVGVFVYFRTSPSSSLLFLFRFLSSYSLRSPLIQKFPPCSPFFLSPVTPSKLKKTAPPVLPPKRTPSTVLVSLFSTFSQYLSSFQTSLYSFLPFSPFSLLSFKLLSLLLSMLVLSSIYRANPCCCAWGAGERPAVAPGEQGTPGEVSHERGFAGHACTVF